MESVLHQWINEDYKQLNVIKSPAKRYLRFEYEHQGRYEWLHVINEAQWY